MSEINNPEQEINALTDEIAKLEKGNQLLESLNANANAKLPVALEMAFKDKHE